MKSIIVNIKNLIPYLLLISIYFFFVNLEAQNNQISNSIDKDKEAISKFSEYNGSNQRLALPVIPYEK